MKATTNWVTGAKRFLYWHYHDTHFARTEKQLAQEKWLIPKLVPFNRWYLMPASFLIETCCGSIYAWSGYNLPIEAKLYGLNGGIDRAIVVNVFYVAVCVFAITAAILGPWLERIGPLKSEQLAATLFFVGNLLTALGAYCNSLTCIYIGYGIFSGAGIGIGSVAPIGPLQTWFPESRGSAAGLALCGYGAGSIVASYVQAELIGRDYPKTGQTDLGIPLTFVILGSAYFVIMCLFSLVLRMPPPGYAGPIPSMVRHHTQRGVPNGKKFDRTTRLPIESKQLDSALVPAPQPARPECVEMTLVESLKSIQFWMIYFMFIGAVLAGLLILSKIQTIIQNQLGGSPQEAVKMNAVLGGLNLLGRLLLPLSSDLLKTRKLIYGISLAVQAVCVGFLPTALHAGNYSGTLACIFIICFFYGGSLGMMPAFLADQFGASIVGATYGVMLTAWALAGVGGGFIFSAVYNQQHAKYPSLDMAYMWYEVNFRWILGPIVLGFFITLFIPTNVRDVKLPRVPGELFRLRLINDRLFRFTKWRGHILTREEEETEWQAYLKNSKIAEKESETHPNGVAAPAKSGDLPGSCELNSVV